MTCFVDSAVLYSITIVTQSQIHIEFLLWSVKNEKDLFIYVYRDFPLVNGFYNFQAAFIFLR